MIPLSKEGRRKHSMTSFYFKTVHHQPSPFRFSVSKEEPMPVETLQNLVRMQQKEIERLEHQNRNLMVLAQHQSGLIQQERQSRTRSMKSMADLPEITKQNQANLLKPKAELGESKQNKVFVRKTAVNRRLTLLFQKEECYKLGNILSQSTPDEDAVRSYEDDGSIQLLSEALNDEDSFLDIIQNYPPQKVSIVYDKLKKLFSEHCTMFHTILKLKKILMASFAISNCKILDEAFQILQTAAKDVMECAQVECYLFDEEKKLLTSRTSNKRYQIGEGLVGYVAQTKETLNLKNAKYDNRFGAENLNVVLASPIMENQKCYGVMLCMEKRRGEFTDEDEQLVEMLSRQVRLILNNVMSHDQLVVQINKFRHTLRSTNRLLHYVNDETKLLEIAQQRLKEMMSCEQAVIKLSNDLSSLGIMGQAIQQKSMVFAPNSYNNPYFHPQVDIKTNLPVVALPIIAKGEVIGGAEFHLVRGAIQGASVSSLEQEVLELFMQNLGLCVQVSRGQNG